VVKSHSARTKRRVDNSGEVEIVGISRHDEKVQKLHNEKEDVRKNALKITSASTEVSFLKTGRRRNTEDIIGKLMIQKQRNTLGAIKVASFMRWCLIAKRNRGRLI